MVKRMTARRTHLLTKRVALGREEKSDAKTPSP